jgi:hypothetical protein
METHSQHPCSTRNSNSATWLRTYWAPPSGSTSGFIPRNTTVIGERCAPPPFLNSCLALNTTTCLHRLSAYTDPSPSMKHSQTRKRMTMKPNLAASSPRTTSRPLRPRIPDHPEARATPAHLRLIARVHHDQAWHHWGERVQLPGTLERRRSSQTSGTRGMSCLKWAMTMTTTTTTTIGTRGQPGMVHGRLRS